MNIKKPNSFARYGNDYVAPLTTIDQIVKPSGERYTDREFELMSNVENVMFGENCAGKNLLNPTLQTQTSNGVTCTNNGDGTYTLNGTASATTAFYLYEDVMPSTKTLKLCGCPKNNGGMRLKVDKTTSPFTSYGNDTGKGSIMNIEDASTCYIGIDSGTVCNNIVYKPMITEDLSATYDDFEPYVKSLRQLTDSALNMDLLWTNASPESIFDEQIINLDLSQYKQIKIVFKLATDLKQVECSNFFNLSDNYIITSMYQTYSGSIGYFVAFREIIYIKASGIYIGNGKKSTSISAYSTNNNLMIPYQIYGVG